MTGSRFAVYVWRSVRAHGDTKTEKSRRTLEVPEEVATALRALHKSQQRNGWRQARRGKTATLSTALGRHRSGRWQHPPVVPGDHQGVRRGGGLDPPRDAAHVRVYQL